MVSMLLFENPQGKLTKQAFHEETKSMIQPFPKWLYLIMSSFRELDFNIQSLRERAYRFSDHSIAVGYTPPLHALLKCKLYSLYPSNPRV